jgi:hypothetical protein
MASGVNNSRIKSVGHGSYQKGSIKQLSCWQLEGDIGQTTDGMDPKEKLHNLLNSHQSGYLTPLLPKKHPLRDSLVFPNIVACNL